MVLVIEDFDLIDVQTCPEDVILTVRHPTPGEALKLCLHGQAADHVRDALTGGQS